MPGLDDLPTTIRPDDSDVVGAEIQLARADHQHAIATAAPSQGIGGGSLEGVATAFARSDHDHAVRETSGPTNLTVGAIADGEYLRRVGGVITSGAGGGGGGAGDVTGPASSTDNAVVRFDATSGKVIQNSAVTVDDSGNVNTAGTITSGLVNGIDVSTTATPTTITPDDAAAVGSNTTLARSNHRHAIAAAAPSAGIGGSNAEGASSSFARADHDHTIRETAGPTNLTVAGITDGQYLKRSGGTITSGTPPGGLGDFVGPASSTDNAVVRFDGTTGKLGQNSAVTIADTSGNVTCGTVNGIDVATTSTPTTIAPDDAAAVGTNATLARSDHRHAVTAAAPSVGIGAGNSEGAASAFARSDHDHKIRESGGTDLTMGAVTDGQFLKRSGTTITSAAGSGSGDVVGPASATDNAIVRFDSTTGKLVQNSAATIADTSGNLVCGTVNAVDVTAHKARHLPGGADDMFPTVNEGETLRKVGSAIQGRHFQFLVKASDETSSTTSLADVTGLGVTLKASAVYAFKFVIRYQTSGTGVGARFAVNFTGTTTSIMYATEDGVVTNAAAPPAMTGNQVATALDTQFGGTTTGPGATDRVCVIEGVITVGGSGGNLFLRYARGTGSGSCTVRTNSIGWIMEATD